MSIESAAIPLPDLHEAKPHPRPMMTPRAKRITWITGKITISAGALAGALIFGAPKVFAMLDARYVLRIDAERKAAADSARNERILDVLCEIKPNARACK